MLALGMLVAPAGLAWGQAASSAPFALPAPSSPSAVQFEARTFDYDRAEAEMHLRGDVRVWDATWTIRAQEAWLDLETREGRVLGPLQVDDGLSRVEGDSGRFEFGSRTGEVSDASAYYAPWRIRASEARLDEKRELWYRGAVFSSCSEGKLAEPKSADPHYHFRASRVHVRPKRYLVARNVRFYLGRVPLFYTPVLWKSLRPRRLLRTRFAPGYDRRNGPFTRTSTLYSFHPAMQGKLFLDYYSRPGFGAGNELQYFASEDGRGAAYGYAIRDDLTRTQRWALLGDHFQALSSTYSAQARLQAQSDPSFHNAYTRANSFRVTQQLVNSAALVRATGVTTTRLVYSRADDGDALRPTRFLKSSESSPRVDFQTAPLSPLRLPFLSVFRAFADNSYDRGRGFQQKSAGAGWEGTRTLVLARGLSLAPRVALEEAFLDRHEAPASFASTRTLSDVFVGHYEAGGTLRLSHRFGDTDLTETFRKRLKPDAIQMDAGAPDYGVEANLLSLAHGFRPSPRVYVRGESGFDFRRFREQAPGFRSRVQPMAGDLVVFLPRGWDLTVHEDYQLEEGNRTLLAQADWGDRRGRFLRFGLANIRPQERNLIVSQEAGWAPAHGEWQLSGALRADVRTHGGVKLHGAQLFEKELSLRKDFHDFHTLLVLRARPGGVGEVQFRLSLRTEPLDIWRRRVYTDYTGR
ncbi:MAG: LPS-assembly protein LptD [Elusimicrobia bacterium]|nr:LPS-assembly protein LptD [Elusimicrobiota bacterium]